MKPLYLLIAICIFSLPKAFGQSFELSDPLDIPNRGWCKVLQMSNGNTLLFHFEVGRAIRIKVFDSTRKKIASEKFIGKTVDLAELEQTDLHGIYEINEEAVVFMSQPISNNHTLVALRFNANSGRIIEEKVLVNSESYKKRNDYSLTRLDSGYAVFCMKDLQANYKEQVYLEKFDEDHKPVLHAELAFDRDQFDYVVHISTLSGSNGAIMVNMLCRKIIHYPKEMDNYLMMCYLPPGGTTFEYVQTKLPGKVAPYYSMFTYNEFDKKINLFLINAKAEIFERGLQKQKKIFYSNNIVVYDEYNKGSITGNLLYHRMANKYLKEEIDSTLSIDPVPIKAYTNRYGISTLISEENEQNLIIDNQTSKFSLVGNIVVTQMNDKGEEVWAAVIPKKQISGEAMYAHSLNSRGVHKELFRYDDDIAEWLHQFMSFSSVMTPKGDCYIVYNDFKSNYDKQINEQLDTAINYNKRSKLQVQRTDAVCYKITRRKEVSKRYLLEDNTQNISASALVESAHYDESTGIYATVFSQRIGDEHVLKLGWCKLE